MKLITQFRNYLGLSGVIVIISGTRPRLRSLKILQRL